MPCWNIKLPTDLSTDTPVLVSVAIDAPFGRALSYASPFGPLAAGTWVSVPFGKKTVLGLVTADAPDTDIAANKIRPIAAVIEDLPAAEPAWIDFMSFAGRYYRRPFGSVAVGLVPKWLRDLKNYSAQTASGRRNIDRLTAAGPIAEAQQAAQQSEPPLNAEQLTAIEALSQPGVCLLHGVTGSGKTRVYTEAARACLSRNDQAQVLMMVPEIGLTPQLVARFTAALPGIPIAVLHSEITERERARLWLLAAKGAVRLVIGTRLSLMTPMPGLKLIMIDEEHDPSYKQQEGMRYSARDLAVWRAQQLGISLLLGSATPSVETWAQVKRGRYRHLRLSQRATGEPPAAIRLVDTLKDPAREGLSSECRAAIASVLQEGGQVLVFLNRRGYAPVLSCASCGWSSHCPDCSVASVLHKAVATEKEESAHARWRLQCHHCGLFSPVPRHCPECGDADLQPIGRGVQRLEQTLIEEFPAARILRIDRDTVRKGRALQEQIDAIERGECDIVVGTQMLAKGHDFARMRLVVVADSDTQLLNPDFRAPERLFATLMQVSGRAGRHEQSGPPAQVLIQTRYPQHGLYQFLMAQDVDGFVSSELEDRRAAGLPPFTHMAAIRLAHADSKKAQTALRAVRSLCEEQAAAQGLLATVYGPVPRYPETVAGKWRGQIMLEAESRAAVHQLLQFAEDWISGHRTFDVHVDVDPHEL